MMGKYGRIINAPSLLYAPLLPMLHHLNEKIIVSNLFQIPVPLGCSTLLQQQLIPSLPSLPLTHTHSHREREKTFPLKTSCLHTKYLLHVTEHYTTDFTHMDTDVYRNITVGAWMTTLLIRYTKNFLETLSYKDNNNTSGIFVQGL